MEHKSRLENYERVAIGLCLNGSGGKIVTSGVTPDMFTETNRAAIFLAIIKASVTGDESNIVALSKFLPPDNTAVVMEIAECMEKGITTINPAEIIRVIKEHFNLRRATKQVYQIYNEAIHSDPLNPYPIFDRIASIDCGVSESNQIESSKDLLPDLLSDLEKSMESRESIGLTTGMPKVDDILGGGLCPNRVITIAARPGGGKTTICINMAKAVMEAGQKAIYFTIEMNAKEMTTKLLSCDGAIPTSKIINRDLSEEHLDDIAKSASKLHRCSELLIASKTGGVWEKLVITLRNSVRYHGVSCAFIDYIQQYRMTKRSTQREELEAMMGQVKDLANELRIPIIVASQLNRNIEQRDDDDPKMSDLKESGAIEQASDTVVILTFKDGKEAMDRTDVKELWACFVKNRWGKLSKTKLEYDFSIGKVWG